MFTLLKTQYLKASAERLKALGSGCFYCDLLQKTGLGFIGDWLELSAQSLVRRAKDK
jgi:hypothetical protein